MGEVMSELVVDSGDARGEAKVDTGAESVSLRRREGMLGVCFS
jgi:hypothetical protein